MVCCAEVVVALGVADAVDCDFTHSEGLEFGEMDVGIRERCG